MILPSGQDDLRGVSIIGSFRTRFLVCLELGEDTIAGPSVCTRELQTIINGRWLVVLNAASHQEKAPPYHTKTILYLKCVAW